MKTTIATKRILFIDDELHVQQVVKACLEVLGGWNVLLAASGQEGLVKAISEKPDAILLDMMMPEMDGLALLQQLKANPVTMKKILLIEDDKLFHSIICQALIRKPATGLTRDIFAPPLPKKLS